MKDWTSAEGGNEQTTPATPDDTIKSVFGAYCTFLQFAVDVAFIRCYSCDSKENKCSEMEYGSKIDCSASKGCRIARKNDLEDPQWERGCAVEADFFCDTFDNPNGEEGVSWE